MEKKELEWGETPFDHLSDEEKLHELKRMYSALQSVYGMLKGSEVPGSPYWSKLGVGGISLEKVRQILDPLHEKYGQSDIYDSYFAYGDDVLFDKNGYRIGSNWHICDSCGQMVANYTEEFEGKPCKEVILHRKGCEGTIRKITKEDLNPIVTSK